MTILTITRMIRSAHGSYKVGKGREFVEDDVPLCPSEEDPTAPGYCNPDLAADNADTLAIMAGDKFPVIFALFVLNLRVRQKHRQSLFERESMRLAGKAATEGSWDM
ncbi:MAG: hypothetical protein Q9208_006908 [Pyrenodesmia sp. 3 TL-2023]